MALFGISEEEIKKREDQVIRQKADLDARQYKLSQDEKALKEAMSQFEERSSAQTLLLNNDRKAFNKERQRERAALQAERDAFIQQKEAAFLKLDELRAEIAQKSEEENNKIEADKQELHLQQLEFVKQQAKAKNNFVTQQKEAFKEAFETRDAELQAWQDRIEKKEAELAEKIKEFYQKEGKLAEREINVTEREEKVDAGLADRVHALAEENKRQHEANQAEAERLKEWANQLALQEDEQKKVKDSLRVREAAILDAEQERDTNYSDERHALDIELKEKRQQHIQMLEKERASSVGDVENELAKLRETRLASIKQDEEIEVARIRGIIVAEKEAWEAEKKAQEVKLQNDKNEIAQKEGALSSWENKLNRLQSELDQEKARLQELEVRYKEQYAINQERLEKQIDEERQRLEAQEKSNQEELDKATARLDKHKERYDSKVSEREENIEDEVRVRIAEERKRLIADKEDAVKNNVTLQAAISTLRERIASYEHLETLLNGRTPQDIISENNTLQEKINQKDAELAKRPAPDTRDRLEELERKYAVLEKQKTDVENQLKNYDTIEINKLQSENAQLKQVKENLEGTSEMWKNAAEEAQAELKRLRAAYERPQEVEARYKEIEMPYFTGADVKQPQKAESPVDELEWLQGINKKCDTYGLHFNPRILKAFHTALKTAEWSPLTVLAGVSGTGKSELPRLYSHFGGIFFEPLSVQPNWDSQESMLGFFNSIDNKFDAQPVLRFLAQSQKEWSDDYPGLKDAVCMVLLDEMNLAHPELYFAEFLSKLELRRGKKAKEVPTLPVKIGAGMKPYELPLGHNILWTGTMNQDETTKSLSDKVLDRSIIIHFPRPTELKRRLELKSLDGRNRGSLLHKVTWNSWLMQKSLFTDEEVAPFKKFIEDMNNALGKVGRAIGHRVWQSVEYYMANYPDVRAAKAGDDKQALAQAMHIAFEDQLVQKVMPKLRGIDTRGASKTECLDKIREQINAGVNEQGFNLVEDFDLARELGYGQFIWQSANYLKESQDDMNS